MIGRMDARRVGRYVWLSAVVASLIGYLLAGQQDALARCDISREMSLRELAESPPDEGDWVRTGGIVTGVFLDRGQLGGFFLQSEHADRPVGLFVHAPRLSADVRRQVQPGYRLQLEARTGRWRDQFQLQRVGELRLCAEPGLPDPVPLHLPATDTALRALAGVLVTTTSALTVTGNHELGRYGSLALANERLRRVRSGDDDARIRQLVLDDGRYTRDPRPIPYLDRESGTRRVGDKAARLAGVLVHQFDAWRIHPIDRVSFSAANPRPDPPPATDDLRLATFNLQNYFVTIGGRGAGSATALRRQRADLLTAIQGLDADLLGLVELENGESAMADLLGHLNRTMDADYASLDGVTQDVGGDAIRTGWVYRRDRLSPVTPVISDTDSIHQRPPQAVVFQPDAGGDPFLAVVVHFKSKTGCPPRGDTDRGEGCWNRMRVAQAQSLAAFADHVAGRFGVDQIVILGDLNSYSAEQPVRRLLDGGYLDATNHHLPDGERYSYVYGGESGMLDYVLVNETMADRLSAAGIWHINADEPQALSYRFRGDTDSERPAPFRSSDHDPVFIDITP